MAIFCLRFFFVVTSYGLSIFDRGLIFNMAAVKELSAIFLGKITVVCGKSEQSGHYDGFALYNTAASATTWLSHATKKLSAICLSDF